MNNKKSNLNIAIATLAGIMSLLIASGRLHDILSKFFSISTGEFYLICLIFCVLICFGIIMYNNKIDANVNNINLQAQVNSLSSEISIIKIEIGQIKEEVDKITPVIKEEFKDIKKEILELYKNK